MKFGNILVNANTTAVHTEACLELTDDSAGVSHQSHTAHNTTQTTLQVCPITVTLCTTTFLSLRSPFTHDLQFPSFPSSITNLEFFSKNHCTQCMVITLDPGRYTGLIYLFKFWDSWVFIIHNVHVDNCMNIENKWTEMLDFLEHVTILLSIFQ